MSPAISWYCFSIFSLFTDFVIAVGFALYLMLFSMLQALLILLLLLGILLTLLLVHLVFLKFEKKKMGKKKVNFLLVSLRIGALRPLRILSQGSLLYQKFWSFYSLLRQVIPQVALRKHKPISTHHWFSLLITQPETESLQTPFIWRFRLYQTWTDSVNCIFASCCPPTWLFQGFWLFVSCFVHISNRIKKDWWFSGRGRTFSHPSQIPLQQQLVHNHRLKVQLLKKSP